MRRYAVEFQSGLLLVKFNGAIPVMAVVTNQGWATNNMSNLLLRENVTAMTTPLVRLGETVLTVILAAVFNNIVTVKIVVTFVTLFEIP
jgi:hypothetical protein